MAIDNFKTVPIKGKGNKGNIEVCNFDKKIIINPKDKSSDVAQKVSDCNSSKPKVQTILTGVSTLQAPDNDWMVIEDTEYYKVPDSQKGTITKQAGKALGRISRIRANVVFVRYQGTLRKMLKMDKNAPYNFIDAEKAIPYYQYVLRNKPQFLIDPKGFEMIAWAEGVDKKVKGTLSFDGDSNFTSNTNLDLGIDGNTDLDLSFDGNTAIDLSFLGNTNLDLGVDGEESGADGEYFYIVKPKTKIFAKNKKTGVIHNTKKKLGKGSKIKGKLIPSGVNKFRVKHKKTNVVSTINKASGFVMIGENDLAQMLVPVSSIMPVNIMKSSFNGDDSNFLSNTNLDLDFDGNTNLDLGADGSRKKHKLTPEQRTARKAKRQAKIAARRAKHQANHAARKAKHQANVATRRSKKQAKRAAKKHSFLGNTNLDLGFDGNTTLDLSFDGGKNRPALDVTQNMDLGFNGEYEREVTNSLEREMNVNLNHRQDGIDGNTNLDLSFDGAAMKKHFRQRPQIEVAQEGLDLGIDGEDNFNGRVRRLVGDNRMMNVRVPVRGRRPALDVSQNMDLGANGENSSFQGGALEEDYHGGGDMLYFDGSEEVSNAFGDWFKGMKEKRAIRKIEKKEKKALSKEEAAVLANENKVVFTEDEMKAVYKSSGSTKPFNEWTKGEGAKNFFNSMVQFGSTFLQKKSQEAAGETAEGDTTMGGDTSGSGDNKGEKKILGMHPVTFTLVAVGTGLLLIGGIYLMSKNKSVATPSLVPVG